MSILVKAGNTVIGTVKKYSPQILLATGIGSGVAGLVMACKQTLKLEETIAPDVDILDRIDSAARSENYTEEDAKKDKRECYWNIFKKGAKLYAVPAALEITALASVIGCYAVINYQKKELASLVVSYANTIATMRERIKDKYGEEAEHEIVFGNKVVETNPETGEVKESYPDALVADRYIVFNRSCANWVNNAEYNKSFLFMVQSMLQDKLNTQGYLSINDVREALGAPYVADYKAAIEEHITGWRAGSTIDFGLTRSDEAVQAFMNGETKDVVLKLNIDGPLKIEQ